MSPILDINRDLKHEMFDNYSIESAELLRIHLLQYLFHNNLGAVFLFFHESSAVTRTCFWHAKGRSAGWQEYLPIADGLGQKVMSLLRSDLNNCAKYEPLVGSFDVRVSDSNTEPVTLVSPHRLDVRITRRDSNPSGLPYVLVFPTEKVG